MRVLLIGPYFANSTHGAEVGVFHALKRLGHKVFVVDPRTNQALNLHGVTINCDFNIHGIFWDKAPDYVLCLGAGLPQKVLESSIWKNIREFDCKTILWNSEPIRLKCYRDKINSQKQHFDYHFTFDKSEIPIYKEMGIVAKFLPQAYNPKWYKPLYVHESILRPMCFVGSIGGKWANRQVFLSRIVEHFGPQSITVSTIFDAKSVNYIYNGHKCVLNLGLKHSGSDDLESYGMQQRIFESIGAGRICITNEVNTDGLEGIKDKETVLFYNKDNLIDTIYKVFDKSFREQMEKNVLDVRNKHTYEMRLRKMFTMLGD